MLKKLEKLKWLFFQNKKAVFFIFFEKLKATGLGGGLLI